MKWAYLIKKLVASITGIKVVTNDLNLNMININYILTLNPLSHDSNIIGHIIVIMIVAILVLIGYTLISNRKK